MFLWGLLVSSVAEQIPILLTKWIRVEMYHNMCWVLFGLKVDGHAFMITRASKITKHILHNFTRKLFSASRMIDLQGQLGI